MVVRQSASTEEPRCSMNPSCWAKCTFEAETDMPYILNT